MKAKNASLLKFLQIILIFLFAVTTTNAQITSKFTTDKTTGCNPSIVKFTDLSTGNPTSWKWDLGNGTTSVLQNPAVSYTTSGTYTVTLIISKGTITDTLIKQNYITIYPTPEVNFIASKRTGCAPLSTDFTDLTQSAGTSITQWQWDFGDGNVSNLQNPSYTYLTEGNYNVKLKATNSFGCFKVDGKSQYIKVNGKLKGGFTYNVTGTCTPPTPVSFQNTSTGSGTLAYQWLFGNGATSTEANPTHIYTSAGSYNVTMIVTNSIGCTDTVIKQNAVNAGAVKANFTTPNLLCTGNTVNITNTSTPATASSIWYFSDGTTSTDTDPTKVFAAPGTYTIKLVNNFGTCLDSITKSVTVLSKPTAAFTAVNHIACNAPATVVFTNNSTNAVSYNWNFGNGNTATIQNPTITYSNLGSYTITLVATGLNGCSDTLTKTDFVNLNKPKINSIVFDPFEGCVPLTVKASALLASGSSISNYQWSFGDGGVSNSATPTHIYTATGTYSLTLVVTTPDGCVDSLKVPDAIKVGKRPVAQFSATPRIVCPSMPVSFTDESTNGPIDKWEWSFGDGNQSDVQNTSNKYIDTGYMTIRLVVWNNGCSDTIIKARFVYVKPPIARFTYANNICDNKLTIVFSDTSIGAVTYLWKFGDGNTSTLRNPTHTYANSGTYKVSLTVYNADCEQTKEMDIRVDKNVGILKITDSVLCKNTNVQFLIDSVNTAQSSSYVWHLDNGNTISSTVPSIDYSFTQSGSYPISVEIVYDNGCIDTLVSNTNIKIYGPTAKFGFPIELLCSKSTVVFTDSSTSDGTNQITNWTWDYGDGNIVSYPSGPFSHNYLVGGNFTVTLKVTDSRGCTDSLITPNAISIAQAIANFMESDTIVCPSTDVQFTNLSLGDSLKHVWSFGDGNQSTQENPLHAYINEGTYSIKLAIENHIGCKDTLEKLLKIRVYVPKAGFTMSDSTAVCPPLLVDMTNTSSNASINNWYFGDGSISSNVNPSNLFTTAGEYFVKLIVRNRGGCADSLTRRILINGPSGSFSYFPILICRPDTVNFNSVTVNTAKISFDFNNGVVNSSPNNSTSHIYTLGGDYLPKLILEDLQGCRVSINGPDTIRVKQVEAFAASMINTICDSAHVQFTDSTKSNDVVSAYNWSFGDGVTSSIRNPTHHYNTNGIYTVKLKATTLAGCTDSVTYLNNIKVISSPKARIAGDLAVCKNGSLQFSAIRTNPDTSSVNWQWSFGNGNVSTDKNPLPQMYNVAGIFNVINTITNSSGCTSTVVQPITVHDLPIVSAGVDTIICRNQVYNLQATGASTYVWTGNTNSLNCTNCPNPIARPLTSIVYGVTGRSNFGCLGTDSVAVTVQQYVKTTVIKGDTLCVGNSVTINATGNADSYTWSPNMYLNNSTTATVNVKPTRDTLINYMLVTKDKFNCFTDTNYIKIKTYPIPQFDIVQTTLNLSSGGRIKVNTTNSPDINTWRWTPTRNLDNPNIPEPTIIGKESSTYRCEVSNQGKCMARDEIKIDVLCNGNNIYLPNTFSPNADGVNDVFYPRGVGVFKIKLFKIFNRWGELVFEKNNFNANDPSMGWNGIYKGQTIPSDAYVYYIDVLCDNNSVMPLKGSITLLR